jgi:flagellar hook-associated protein 2
MVSVSSTGKVEGVNVHAMFGAVAAQAQPGAANPVADVDVTTDEASISAVGKLKSAAAAVLDAAAALTQQQTWSATQATSSRPDLLEVSGSNANPGNYNVTVDAVALPQTASSSSFSSLSTVVGIGTLDIELGHWNGAQSTFATNPNWPKATVTLGPKDNTMERIRDRINAAGVGVIASVVTDATGSRLVLRSTTTGSDNGFRVQTDDSAASTQAGDAAKLAELGFDPAAVDGGMRLTQAGQDARLRVDDRTVRSSQNFLQDEDSGLSLHAKASSTEPVTVSVTPDTDSMARQVSVFAMSYNNLVDSLRGVPADAAPGDVATGQAITRTLSDLVQSSGQNLAAMGVQLDAQGQMKLDSERLQAALQTRPQAVQDALGGNQGLSGQLLSRLAPAASTPATSAPSAGTVANERPSVGTAFRQRMLQGEYDFAHEASASVDDDLSMATNGA